MYKIMIVCISAVMGLAVAEPADDSNARLELVLDIDLPLVVRFGRTLMSIKALADLGRSINCCA